MKGYVPHGPRPGRALRARAHFGPPYSMQTERGALSRAFHARAWCAVAFSFSVAYASDTCAKPMGQGPCQALQKLGQRCFCVD